MAGEQDLRRAIGFVLAGIFIVLLVMLRSVVAPRYRIATVLLSFTFTLGLTNLVFEGWRILRGWPGLVLRWRSACRPVIELFAAQSVS